MRVSKTREGPITAVFRIRGQAPEAIILPCQDWEQAIRKARRMLPCFEQRNPWLFLDSGQQRLYVLLDPETEPQTVTDKGLGGNMERLPGCSISSE